MNTLKKFIFLFLAMLSTSVILPAEGDDPFAGLSTDQKAKLIAGEVVLLPDEAAGGGAKRIRAALIFNQPIEKTWEILSHPETEDEYLDECDEAILIAQGNNENVVEYRVTVMLSTIKYRVKHKFQPDKHSFVWSLDPSFENDLKVVEGEWKLYPFEGKTVARYATRVDVSALIPDFIQRRLANRDVPKSLEAVRKRVNSGGVWKKGK